MRLENKKAIVTGAAKGMGAAITTTLAREGADVLLTARDTAALEEVAAQVRALGREAHVIACDVIEEAQVKAMVDKANDALDSILNSLAHMTDDELQEIIARTLADVAVHKAAIAERDSR